MRELLIFAFFLYFPYGWCALLKEDRAAFGLLWRMDRGAFKDVLAASGLTLFPLTIIALTFFKSHIHPLPAGAIPGALLAGFGAAVAEETFFRGWVQTLLRRRFPRWPSVISASAVFGLAHLLSPLGPFATLAFFPGLVMGYLRDRHGSVLPAILFHWVGNLWSIWFYPRF